MAARVGVGVGVHPHLLLPWMLPVAALLVLSYMPTLRMTVPEVGAASTMPVAVLQAVLLPPSVTLGSAPEGLWATRQR